MKKKEIFPVIKQDFVRAVLSWKFVISIILGVVICYFTVAFCGNYKSETIHKFIMLHDRSQSFWIGYNKLDRFFKGIYNETIY